MKLLFNLEKIKQLKRKKRTKNKLPKQDLKLLN